ncbi:MAG: hypothetical protein QM539_08740 [Alphaproteobacteria bacterium]|nr:hypothetical protein [Alphaproteobacteria bacterium]
MNEPSINFLKKLNYNLFFLLCFIFNSCNKNSIENEYTIKGTIIDNFGNPLRDFKIYYNTTQYVFSDNFGNWEIVGLKKETIIKPQDSIYLCYPRSIQVFHSQTNIKFEASKIINRLEAQIFNWFYQQQLSNGLLESAENSNVVSLYDNALAALVFMLKNDYTSAEKIFNYFNSNLKTELQSGVGGFSQFRDRNGKPNYHRWMGDNAWLLIALNNYRYRTGNNQYDSLALGLKNWLVTLQDQDGGLFAGYNASSELIINKITEGNIDAFNAITGFTDFHSKLLNFLKINRWNIVNKNLEAWPENLKYLYALDLQSWGYLILKDYSIAALDFAKRFITTQTAVNGLQITGYCFDEDKDVVWLEGTAQMALAFRKAGLDSVKNFYLSEIEKVLITSSAYTNAYGFPYTTNKGTTYGDGLLWSDADSKIALSSGAWYLFTTFNFSPFFVQFNKDIPTNIQFWNQ